MFLGTTKSFAACELATSATMMMNSRRWASFRNVYLRLDFLARDARDYPISALRTDAMFGMGAIVVCSSQPTTPCQYR